MDDPPPHRGLPLARTGKVFPYAMHRIGESSLVLGRYVLAVDDGNAYLAAGLAGSVPWLPDYMGRAHAARRELVPLFREWRLDRCRCTWRSRPTGTSA